MGAKTNHALNHAHHFGHLEANGKKNSTILLYLMHCRCAPAISLHGATKKTVRFVQVVPKVHGSATNCTNQNAIKRCKFGKVCDFLNHVYRLGSVFSCGNGHVASAGSAVPQSRHCFDLVLKLAHLN